MTNPFYKRPDSKYLWLSRPRLISLAHSYVKTIFSSCQQVGFGPRTAGFQTLLVGIFEMSLDEVTKGVGVDGKEKLPMCSASNTPKLKVLRR